MKGAAVSDEEAKTSDEKTIDVSSYDDMKAASAATSEGAVASWLGISPPTEDQAEDGESKDGS